MLVAGSFELGELRVLGILHGAQRLDLSLTR